MPFNNVPCVRTRLVRAIAGGAVVALPLAFPGWINAIAQSYESPDLPDNGAISDNGAIVRAAILATCQTGANGQSPEAHHQAFQNDCSLILDGTEAEQISAFNQLAADQIGAMNAVTARQFQTQIGLIGTRLKDIRTTASRSGSGQFHRLASSQGLQGEFGGGAGDADSFGRLGGFFNLKYRAGDQDKTAKQEGFDYEGWGLIAGADYRISDNLVAGVSLNYLDDDVSYDAGRGDMYTQSWGGALYGSMFLDGGFHVDGMLGYNKNDYSLNRRIRYTVAGQSADQTGSSNPDGSLFSATIGGGYDMDYQGWGIQPMVRLDYFRNKVDGFSERMSNPGGVGGSMALNVDSVTFTSLTSHVGASLSRAISYSRGVLVPQVRVDWIHEFENDGERIGARFINDINAQPVFVLTDNGDPDYFDVGISLAGQFADGKSAFISYDTLLGLEHVTHHAINAGLRMEF